MARIFDVIEYPNEMRDEIVHRFPEVGAGNFRIGSQVIVRESQAAVFFRDGNALDVFGPGRHTITTYNIPLLIDLIGKQVQQDQDRRVYVQADEQVGYGTVITLIDSLKALSGVSHVILETKRTG